MKLGLDAFRNALESAILSEDRVIVLHSAIWTFGHLFRCRTADLCNDLLDAVFDVAGGSRTLVMPAYSSSFTRTKAFDMVNSEPDTGVLAKQFLRRQGTARTAGAINSYAVYGPETPTVKRLTGTSVWGEGSVMEWFETVNARICVIGIPFHLGVSLIHRAEEIVQVPYRYYKSFNGILTNCAGETTPRTERMYVRTLKADTYYEPLTTALLTDNLLLAPQESSIPISSALARDIISVGVKLLDKDPLVFVRNRAEIARWIIEERAQEIAQLEKETLLSS